MIDRIARIKELADEYATKVAIDYRDDSYEAGGKQDQIRAALHAELDALLPTDCELPSLPFGMFSESGKRAATEYARAAIAPYKADAERYRWLRNSDNANKMVVNVNIGHDWVQSNFEQLDRAIDTALGEKP